MRRIWLAVCLLLAPLQAVPEEIRFRDAAESWGLRFRHHHGGAGDYHMVETYGGGVVIFDFDGDGDQDVFLIDGAPLPGYTGEKPRSVLYRNDGDRFVDVTDRAGLRIDVYGTGGSAGDIDNDGDLDLYVSAFGTNLLFENRGDGSFREVGRERGVDDPAFASSVAFADPDLDGDLDLYVVNYVDTSLENNILCGDQRRRLRGYCGPDVYNPLPDSFFRNRGDGSFDSDAAAAGLGGAVGPGLGLCFGDLDDDGWPDLYVANDNKPNFLFHNRGGGVFEDLSLLSGTAIGDRGVPEAGMGVDIGDYNADGRLDIVVTNYEGETTGLFHNRGAAFFTDQRFVSRLAEPSLLMLTFGVDFADLDHDGDLDLVTANGHVRDNAADFNRMSVYRQPNQVFENLGGSFREVTDAGLDAVRSSRGLATGDLDGDGDLDLVIGNIDEEAEVYENLLEGEAGWLQVDVSLSGGNRYGVGCRVELEAGGTKQLGEVKTSSSYLSQNALTLHFGLAAAARVDRLTLRCPTVAREMLDLPSGRRLHLSD